MENLLITWQLLMLLLAIVPIVLILWSIIDLVKRNFNDPANKVIWLLVILFVPIAGALTYLIVGRNAKFSQKNKL